MAYVESPYRTGLLCFLLSVVFVAVKAQVEECPAELESVAVCDFNGDNKVGESGRWNSKKECDQDGCCWREKDQTCLRKPKQGGGESPEVPNFPLPPSNKEIKRTFLFQPDCNSAPVKFPDNCRPHKDSLYVMDPPIDIPYCVRIPCSRDPSKQRDLEKSHFLCGSEPGCYFDRELFEYRDAYGEGHMPGVPVCHLAIRNPIFRDKARYVIDSFGFWTPYFTECLLDTFYEEFRKGPEGCKLISLLEVFHVSPKLAGWGDITPTPCGYIGGCWIRNRGCFYPVHPDKHIVPSGQYNKFNVLDIPFGRPKCQYFNPSTPYSLLKSYHRCLSAGCTLDFSYAINYYYHLFDLGETMSVEEHWKYWEQVMDGMVGPHNIDELPYKFDKSIGFNAPPPQLPGLPDLDSPGTRGLIPSLPRSKSKRCGYPFQDYGFRPCPPPNFPDIHYNRLCPYKPFHPPRFPALKGSLKGCCNINPCYIQRSKIQYATSGPTHYYTDWSPYSECTKTKRYRKRSRTCVTARKELCKEPTQQRQRCRELAKWGDWEPWSSCESFDICAKTTRVRYCLPKGESCDGKRKQERTQLCYVQMKHFCQ